MQGKIKLGIIGIGNMGSGHAGNIKNGCCPEIELTAIADINPERLDFAKQQNYAENITYFSTAAIYPGSARKTIEHSRFVSE